MSLIRRLERSTTFWLLFILSFTFFILRFPSLFEPYWYGDEGIYQAVGLILSNGGELYKDAWENKPPLLLAIYAFFNSDQLLLRIATFFTGLFSTIIFYFLAKELFPKSQKSVIVSSAFFVLLLSTPLIEGNIANAENFMILPITASALILFLFEKMKSRALFFGGLILGIAFIMKIVAVFDFLAFSLFLLMLGSEDFKLKIKNLILPFSMGFALPAGLTMVYFFLRGNFENFMQAFLLSNVGYVNYGNEYLIPQGLLIFKALLLALFVLAVFLKKNSLSKPTLFVLLWLGFSVFNAFFSQRPYIHYLLVVLPAFSLLTALMIYERKIRASLVSVFFLTFVLLYFIEICPRTCYLQPVFFLCLFYFF